MASPESLSIRYEKPVDFPGSPQANEISLRVGCLPFVQLDQGFLADGKASLPGLDIHLTGSIVEQGVRSVAFSKATKLHGAFFYEVKYKFPESLREAGQPELVIGVKKTTPPAHALLF